jgi:hypothetical protein
MPGLCCTVSLWYFNHIVVEVCVKKTLGGLHDVFHFAIVLITHLWLLSASQKHKNREILSM